MYSKSHGLIAVTQKFMKICNTFGGKMVDKMGHCRGLAQFLQDMIQVGNVNGCYESLNVIFLWNI